MTLTDLQKRAILFWVGCIGTRLGLVWLAKNRPKLLPYMGVVAIGIAIGFTAIFFGGLRKTGAETFGQPIWWNNLRLLHAFLYGLFAYYALHNDADTASTILGIDVAIGMAAWIHNRM